MCILIYALFLFCVPFNSSSISLSHPLPTPYVLTGYAYKAPMNCAKSVGPTDTILTEKMATKKIYIGFFRTTTEFVL